MVMCGATVRTDRSQGSPATEAEIVAPDTASIEMRKTQVKTIHARVSQIPRNNRIRAGRMRLCVCGNQSFPRARLACSRRCRAFRKRAGAGPEHRSGTHHSWTQSARP
ncbi:hypothetical protein HYPSUDRAFT_817763 [Hypholoma sublateritium FD-334 SS-4]|uniref:Uncharacterized protein n=1 Tax=Hypholoma sublateritium (strain FD-334 SS-4) TaxID=945553 RepID=A0A0D2NUY6_HYPSF|nr:hypothetical protein HYPSUDRAFT_817763 [Hypholoma sublateritium FD-334 SS-4]